MTRKDFQLIADVVGASSVTANLTDVQVEDLAYEFAKKLRAGNPRFDAVRFFRACAVDGERAIEASKRLDAGHSMFG